MFSPVGYHPAMPATPQLRPATADEIAEALSFALRYQGRKRVHHAAIAAITGGSPLVGAAIGAGAGAIGGAVTSGNGINLGRPIWR